MSFPDLLMIPIVELLRIEEHNSFGTFGILKLNKSVFCVTLEPPDKLNKMNKSSIPAQQYICRRHKSPSFGVTFQITNVPDRSNVLFHPGNLVENTQGCILLAQHFGKLKGQRAVLNSGVTFDNFMNVMHDVGFFHLTITEHY